MSTKTNFKRIALVAAAALGLGLLSVTPSQAQLLNQTLVVNTATATITAGETATTTLTHTWTGTVTNESLTVASTCLASVAGAACPTLSFGVGFTDTSNIMPRDAVNGIVYNSTLVESTTGTTSAPVTSQATIRAKAVSTNGTAAGTYTYTIYTTGGLNTAGEGANNILTGVSATFTLTVSAANTTVSSFRTYLTTDVQTGLNARLAHLAGVDSAIVASKGTAATPVAVGYLYGLALNSAGDTYTAANKAQSICARTGSYCSATVSITGPGFVSLNTGSNVTPSAKVVTMVMSDSVNALVAGETVTVWSDGSAGTSTITITSGTASKSLTVTFTGPMASATVTQTATNLVIPRAAVSGTIATIVPKDSAGNAITTGNIYAYSSDTGVISDSGTACTAADGAFTCTVTAVDSGTATIVYRDSSTVGNSTFVTSAITIRVAGTTPQIVTASFDKTSYAPGEKALLTITAKDQRGGLLDNGAVSSAFVVTGSRGYTVGTGGTVGSGSVTESTFTPYLETGVETRVIYMPTVGGAFDLTIKKGTGSWAGMADVVASATVADPTKDAADAATDAALEATDAAYAAQDAAQLAAEAADAATAAAEAATAAVEDLATQVASLFADLQKQITTLANVVAKIAKKVKA